MSHKAQQEFCQMVKGMFPDFFKNVKVLDVGSLDINGSNKDLFEESDYAGLDIGPGPNVDIVSLAHEYQAPDESYDVIISTECFEHDMHWEKSLVNIIRMLKVGGLFVFTCASDGRPEHGTRRTKPEDAPLLEGFGEWGDYYKNLNQADIRTAIDVDKIFWKNGFIYEAEACDLYFFGIKK